jgi:WD40 repeat protein
VTLASGATDATAKLWSGNGKLLRTLAGHSDRLGRIAFHPMGRHLGGWLLGRWKGLSVCACHPIATLCCINCYS